MKKTETGKALNGYDMAPIRHLVDQAIAELTPGNLDTERAVWRLIDAAGLLAAHYPDAVGVAQSTGRNTEGQVMRKSTMYQQGQGWIVSSWDASHAIYTLSCEMPYWQARAWVVSDNCRAQNCSKPSHTHAR